MKLALRFGLAIALAAALFWLWRGRGTRASEAAMLQSSAEAARLRVEPAPDADTAISEPVVESTPTRNEVEAPRLLPLAIDAPPARPEVTLLKVRVVSKERGEPIARQRVMLTRHDARERGWSHVDGSRAREDQAPLTDSNGGAEFEVEPSKDYTVQLGDRWSNENGLKVPALAPGEAREVVLAIAVDPDIVLYGRLIDAENAAPIADGVVRFDAGSLGNAEPAAPLQARADGTFELHARSWHDHFAGASAREYARVVFAVETGHETPDTALEVRLARAATLEVVVFDGALPVSDAWVELTTKAYFVQQRQSIFLGKFYWTSDDPDWKSRTDANGRAELGELPPRVPLTLAVTVRQHDQRTEAEPLTLEPGEHKRVEVRLGSGASIVGRVEDGAGKPVASCEIWRVAGKVPVATLLESYQKPVDTSFTDVEGRFRFDDVPTGTWLVGPPKVSQWDEEARTAEALCGLAQPVRVEPDSQRIVVLIRVDRGLYVKGTVLSPDDQIVPQCMVHLSMEGTALFAYDNTDESGRFTIGPLPAGNGSLQVGGWGGKYATSASISVKSGASDIIVRVQVGGSIRGRVVDASGQLRDGELVLTRASEESSWIMTGAPGGEVKLEGLVAGTYTLSATTSDGWFGTRGGLVVRLGEALEDIEVALQPGATLKLRYSGEQQFASFEIVATGVVVGGYGLERGTTATRTVPAGDIEVHWRTPPDRESTASQRLTLSAGEVRELVWDGGK